MKPHTHALKEGAELKFGIAISCYASKRLLICKK